MKSIQTLKGKIVVSLHVSLLFCNLLVCESGPKISPLQTKRQPFRVGLQIINQTLNNLEDINGVAQLYKYIGDTVVAGLSETIIEEEGWMDLHSSVLHQLELVKKSHEEKYIKYRGLSKFKSDALGLYRAIVSIIERAVENNSPINLLEMEYDGIPLHEVIVELMTQVKLGFRESHLNVHKVSTIEFK